MSRRRWLPILAGVALLAACAPRMHMQVLEPGFDGTRTYRMTGNALGGAAPALQLNLERVDLLAGAARFFVVLESQGEPRLLIPAGETLLIVVESDTLRLSGAGSADARSTLEGAIPYERARYPVTGAQVRRIAAATRVLVRGTGARVQRELDERNRANVRLFVSDYVERDPERPSGK